MDSSPAYRFKFLAYAYPRFFFLFCSSKRFSEFTELNADYNFRFRYSSHVAFSEFYKILAQLDASIPPVFKGDLSVFSSKYS
jgi:hypothetical protein